MDTASIAAFLRKMGTGPSPDEPDPSAPAPQQGASTINMIKSKQAFDRYVMDGGTIRSLPEWVAAGMPPPTGY